MRSNTILIFLLCASCFGKGDNANLTKDVSLVKTTEEALETELFAIGDYPEQNWYEEFHDECLSCLIQTALAKNPGLEGMQKRVEVANQTAMMTRSKLFPEISGLFQYAWLYLVDSHFIQDLLPGVSANKFLYNLMFNFSYEFDFWGKNLKKYRASLGTMNATRLQYEQSKLILMTSVAKSYFNLMSKRAKLEVLSEMLSKKEKYLNLVKLRRKNRLDSKIDVHTFNQKVKGLEEAVIAVQREILLEESLINILVGANPETEVKTKAFYDAPSYKLELPEKITTTLLARRPDLLSSLWVTKKNALDIGVAVTEFLPDVTLMEGPAFLSTKGSELLTKDAFANLLFPEITQPLFTGGRLLANWRKSKANYEASVYEFNDLFLRAAKDVRDSMIKFTESEERYKLQEKKLSLTKQNYELEFLRFSHGVASMLTVLEYDETYLMAKSTFIERERMKKMSYIEFIKSLGGGFKGSEADLEK